MELHRALTAVADVMRAGTITHPNNDWVRLPVEHHVARAEEHLRRLRDGDQREDHLAHAATRLPMAQALREVS